MEIHIDVKPACAYSFTHASVTISLISDPWDNLSERSMKRVLIPAEIGGQERSVACLLVKPVTIVMTSNAKAEAVGVWVRRQAGMLMDENCIERRLVNEGHHAA